MTLILTKTRDNMRVMYTVPSLVPRVLHQMTLLVKTDAPNKREKLSKTLSIFPSS